MDLEGRTRISIDLVKRSRPLSFPFLFLSSSRGPGVYRQARRGPRVDKSSADGSKIWRWKGETSYRADRSLPPPLPANEWIDLRGSLTIHVRNANAPLCFVRPRREPVRPSDNKNRETRSLVAIRSNRRSLSPRRNATLRFILVSAR